MPPARLQFLDPHRAMDYVGDASGVQHLLATLAQSLAEDLPQLQALLAQADLAGANRILHQFKGFAPVFCVPALVERVVQVEALSKQPEQLAAVREAYATLGPQLQALLQEVQSQLETPQN